MAAPAPEKLPRRDLLLLPLIAVFTAFALAASAEMASRLFFSENEIETCVQADPVLVWRIKPNCVSTMKAAEGPVVENRFNDCGYRTKEPCGTKQENGIRVALLGSSFVEGFLVPYEQTFAARATEQLTKACRRPVEFQNLGLAGYQPLEAYHRLDEAVALKPDLVMMGLVPFELERPIDPQRLADRDNPSPLSHQMKPEASDPLAYVKKELTESRGVLAAQHFMFQDRDTYARLFLMYGDKADYLRPPFTPAWEQRFRDIDVILGDMAKTVHAAGLDFVLLVGPQRIQAALLGNEQLGKNLDPFAFGRRITEIAERHGILVLNSLPAFAQVPGAEKLFYAVDGHLNAGGHDVLAAAVSARFADGSVPAFAGCGGAPAAAASTIAAR
jgi:hypothetical protein